MVGGVLGQRGRHDQEEKRKMRFGRLVSSSPGSSSVVYLVIQNGNLEYEERRCGFNTKHQSTKAPKPKAGRGAHAALLVLPNVAEEPSGHALQSESAPMYLGAGFRVQGAGCRVQGSGGTYLPRGHPHAAPLAAPVESVDVVGGQAVQ